MSSLQSPQTAASEQRDEFTAVRGCPWSACRQARGGPRRGVPAGGRCLCGGAAWRARARRGGWARAVLLLGGVARVLRADGRAARQLGLHASARRRCALREVLRA